MALTDTVVRQAKADSKDYSLNDNDGLSLYVTARGGKSWHFRFSWADKQPRISLGTYPEVSLREARERRDECRALVAKDIDPRMHRRTQRAAAVCAAENTFEVVFQLWRAFKAMSLKTGRQSTLSQIDRIFNKDVLPTLRNLSIFEIKRQDLLEILRKIERRRALTTAEKCRTWFNQLFRFAMVEVNLPENPAADLDIVAMPQPPVKHNPFLRMHELPAFLGTLRAYGGETKTQLGLWLLLLTGVRTGELRLAMRDQFDLEQGLWIIPAEVVKQLQQPLRTEDRDIPPYIVPLPRQAIEIFRHLLDDMAPAQRYLLAHRSDLKKRISENTLNAALKRLGYKDRLTGHGIRGTISTALNELGYNGKWVDAQLSHTDPNQISSAYNHAEYVEQRRAMMQDWADRLDAWANQPPDADKIPMNASNAQVVASHTISPPNPALVHAAVADNTMANGNPDAPPPAPPSPMTIIARRDHRPQPVVTDFQRAHAEMLATFEAPQNLPVPVFAKLAGKSRDQINREIKARRLLSISLGNRGQRIPEWQLNPLCQRFVCQVMERAQRIDSWVLYRALSEPRDDLEGLAPVAAVTAGKLAAAEELVFAQLGLD
ncbi:MAG: integrase [Burkholderiales bacterium RIFCSPHIGHO2_01_FULL_64_960]|nr:MAG: integrase [Burkholderiales bacterium RIFCSPHIGHO2_01_FULL_64_960]